MNSLRAALLTVALALLALLLAWSLRHSSDYAPRSAVDRASLAEAPKKPAPPPARDFPRRPPPQDAAFADPPAEGEAPDPAHPWAAYLKTCAEIRTKLGAVKIDLDRQDVDLTTMLADIEAKLGIHLNVDVAADILAKRITFAVKDLAIMHTLRLLLQQYDLTYVISADGQIWIEAPPGPGQFSVHEPAFMADLKALKDMSASVIAEGAGKPHAEADGRTKATMETIKVSLNFEEMPLPEAISFLQELTNLNIMIDRRQVPDTAWNTPITTTCENVPMDKALSAALGSHELDWRVDDGVLVITTKEAVEAQRAAAAAAETARRERVQAEQDLFARPVAFGGENLRLREVAEILAKGLGVPYVIDPGTWSRKARYTIEELQRPASGIVALLKKGAPLIVTYRNGILWFLSPDGVK